VGSSAAPVDDLAFDCPRCGTPFPGDNDPEEGALRVIGADEVVVCPDCATPVDYLHQELDRMGVG
jgi:hypothetical protein